MLCLAQSVKPDLNLKGNKLEATVTQLISFKTGDNNNALDTARYLEFTIELEPLKQESYLLTLDNFNSKVPFSNSDDLNKLVAEFRSSEKYVLVTNLDFSEFELENKKHVKDMAKTYLTNINRRLQGINHSSITIPNDSEGAIYWCTELIEPIFNGYKIDLTKDFEYPVETGLPEPNHTFRDTLHIKINTETENPNIETSMRSSGDEINQAVDGTSFSSDFYMFSTTKYFVKEDGRIEQVNIHAGNGSSQHQGEMWMTFEIKFTD